MASKLYVGGLSYSTTSEGLQNHFAQCGSVESAQVVTDRVTGQSRGFGFVEMATEVDAKAAIGKLDDQPFEGRRLKVQLASSPGPKSGDSTSGGGSRSRGGVRAVRW